MYKFEQISFEDLDFLSKNPSRWNPYPSFVQSAGMAYAQASIGSEVVAYGVSKKISSAHDPELVAAALVTIRKVRKFFKVAHINQGPVIDVSNTELVRFFFTKLRAALEERGVTYCLVTPNIEVVERDLDGNLVPNGYNNSEILAHLEEAGLRYCGPEDNLINGVGRWMFVKDLDGIDTESKFFKSADRSIRRNFQKSLNINMKIRELSEDDLTPFFDVLNHTGERRGFESREDFLQALKKSFGDHCHVYVSYLDVQEGIDKLQSAIKEYEKETLRTQKQLAKQDTKGLHHRIDALSEQISATQERIKTLQALMDEGYTKPNLSVGMFIEFVNEITHFVGGSYDKYMHAHLGGNHFLTTSQMLYSVKAPHIQRYNFYGAFGGTPDTENDGVYQFKRRFGGKIIEQPGNYELIVSPRKMRLYHMLGKLTGRE